MSADDQAKVAPKLPWHAVKLNCYGHVIVRGFWRVDALVTHWLRHNAYRLPGYGAFYRASNRLLHRHGLHWFRRTYTPPGRWCSWCGLRIGA